MGHLRRHTQCEDVIKEYRDIGFFDYFFLRTKVLFATPKRASLHLREQKVKRLFSLVPRNKPAGFTN